MPDTVKLPIVALIVLNAAEVMLPVVVRLPPTSAPLVTDNVLVVMLPVTVNAVRLPRLVMPDNVPGASVPLNVPPVIVPPTVKLPSVPLVALIDAAVTAPVEVRLPLIVAPLLTVMLLTVALAALIAAAVTLPVVVKLPPISAPPVTDNVLAVMLPVTVNAVRLFRLVMPASVPADKVPLKVPPVIVPGTDKLPIVPLTALIAWAVTLPVAVMLPPKSAPLVTDKVLVVVLPDTVIAVKPPSVVILF